LKLFAHATPAVVEVYI